MTAFADASGNMYNFNCENLNYIVEYIMDDSTVTEKITIYEKGNTPILLEKIVTSDGTITVYQNGIQTVTLTGGNYAQYVSVSQGHEPQLLTGSHNDSTSTQAGASGEQKEVSGERRETKAHPPSLQSGRHD